MPDYRITYSEKRGVLLKVANPESAEKNEGKSEKNPFPFSQFTLKPEEPLFLDNKNKDSLQMPLTNVPVSTKGHKPFPVFLDKDDVVFKAGIQGAPKNPLPDEIEIEVEMDKGKKTFKGAPSDTDGDGKPDFVFIRQ
jgi:hypothetical protein